MNWERRTTRLKRIRNPIDQITLIRIVAFVTWYVQRNNRRSNNSPIDDSKTLVVENLRRNVVWILLPFISSLRLNFSFGVVLVFGNVPLVFDTLPTIYPPGSGTTERPSQLRLCVSWPRRTWTCSTRTRKHAKEEPILRLQCILLKR